jgi:hypothetical protein
MSYSLHGLNGELDLNSQCLFHYFRNGVLVDSTLLAVIRLNPIGKVLGSFARIAREAASGDVFPIDYSRIVNDVLPRRDIPPGAMWRHLLGHLDATIDASLISFLHFLFKPIRDAPIVHVHFTDGSLTNKLTDGNGAQRNCRLVERFVSDLSKPNTVGFRKSCYCNNSTIARFHSL